MITSFGMRDSERADIPSHSAFEPRRESPPQILRGMVGREVLNIQAVARAHETHTHHGAQGKLAVAGRKRQHFVAGIVTQHARPLCIGDTFATEHTPLPYLTLRST